MSTQSTFHRPTLSLEKESRRQALLVSRPIAKEARRSKTPIGTVCYPS